MTNARLADSPSICSPSGFTNCSWYQCPPAFDKYKLHRNVVHIPCEPVSPSACEAENHGDIQWRIPFDTVEQIAGPRFFFRFNTVQRFFFGNIRFEGIHSNGQGSLLYTGGLALVLLNIRINKMTRAMDNSFQPAHK